MYTDMTRYQKLPLIYAGLWYGGPHARAVICCWNGAISYHDISRHIITHISRSIYHDISCIYQTCISHQNISVHIRTYQCISKVQTNQIKSTDKLDTPPDGSPGPSKYVNQFISVKVSTLFPSLPCSALQPARACKRHGRHSQPDNHDAICPDPVARLAPRSQGRVDSGYGVARNDSEGFRVNLDPLAVKVQATSCNRRQLS